MVDRQSRPAACGQMIKLCTYPDADAVAHALARALLEAITARAPTPRAIMLAGGRTPKAAYAQVASSGATIPPGFMIAISDERHVPPDHPDSNINMMRSFLEAVKCGPDQRIMVDTTLPREESAADFGQQLDAFFDSGGKLETCYLGLGADGHTAALFSTDDLQRSEGRSAVSVDRPDGKVGISASPSIIRRAEKIIFVVTGEDKREMVDKLLRRPSDIVAGMVVLPHPRIEVWVDRAARPATNGLDV